MTDWTEGYVSDIPYALGFYRETVPAHIAFAAICCGKHPGLIARPKKVLELGFGMGLGFVINAASNPHTYFEGVDFNPLHVAHAQSLVDEAELTNVSIREASFQDLATEAREGQQDVDLIVLHGILTWVSADAHEAIVEIARKRLKSGGFLYVSYNCMPGWAPMLPLQRLMRENAKSALGRSDQQTASGVELLKSMIAENARYLALYPSLTSRIDKLAQLDKSYLAHEYLNANWFIFHFADVAEMFSDAKLNYVASANIIENIDGLSVPEGSRARINAAADPIFKETLRDIASNKQFRRDIYGRGVAPAAPVEHSAILNDVRFALAVPRSRVSLKLPSPIGDLDCDPSLYGAVADLLAEREASFAEIAALPVSREKGRPAVLQALALLVHSGQVFPITGYSSDIDPTAGQRLNRVIVRKMLQGRTYSYLAAPMASSGVQAAHSELLLLGALISGQDESLDVLTVYVLDTMKRLGFNWLKDGQAVSDETKRRALFSEEVATFLTEKLPIWRRLGVI